LINLIIAGMKIINPVMKATIAEIRTPPAERSLAIFILGSYSGNTASLKYSIAVLRHSLARTSPAARDMVIQLISLIPVRLLTPVTE
jgi:hypothetical protein